MPLPRMTTRRWMIAVAVVGLTMAVWTELIRRKWFSEFQARAEFHGAAQSSCEALLANRSMGDSLYMSELGSMWRMGKIDLEEFTKREREMLARKQAEKQKLAEQIKFHSRMRAKYEGAARYPLLPVPPDPPEPE